MSRGTLAKFDDALKEGNEYETLQLMKTLFYRSTHGDDDEECMCSIFQRGIEAFLSKDDVNGTCAIDAFKSFMLYLYNRCSYNRISKQLCDCMRNTLVMTKSLPESQRRDCISIVYLGFRQIQKEFKPVCQWSKPDLFDINRLIASIFIEENDHYQAYIYLMRSKDVNLFTDYVYKRYHDAGYPSECAAFIALPSLQLLSHEKFDKARTFYNQMVLKHSNATDQPNESDLSNPIEQLDDHSDERPGESKSRAYELNGELSEVLGDQVLLNFVDLLIDLCSSPVKDRKSYAALACGYKSAYAHDDALHYYVNLIGQTLFDVRGEGEQRNRPNILMNMVQSLLSRS